MLEMRLDCESCGNDDSLHGSCPNCGGSLTARPIRSAELLAKYPASIDRKYK